jgi:acetyl-CoA carboxylase biotin carboxyl carrier protein
MSAERIKELLEFMEKHDLAEMEVEEEGFRVKLVKSRPQPPMMVPAVAPAVPAVAAVPTAGGAAKGGAAPAATPARAPGLVEITSPIVGTFYRAPAPDADPFVEAGTQVEPDTTICIIEAMKVMNEVKAEKKGVIREVLVENGQPVEYGQPIFLLEPTA